MTENNNYFIVKKKALPEVLLKVVEAKRLLEADKNMTKQEAMNRVGISRSSYYKYKDDIMPFRENLQGKTITFMIIMEDIPGLRLFTGEMQSGTLSVCAAQTDCETLAARLASVGVCVRAGLHCAPLAHESAGTLETGTVRFSLSAFNTDRESFKTAKIMRSCLA